MALAMILHPTKTVYRFMNSFLILMSNEKFQDPFSKTERIQDHNLPALPRAIPGSGFPEDPKEHWV